MALSGSPRSASFDVDDRFRFLLSGVPVSGDDRGIELAADRCNQGVGPVQVGSDRRDLVRDASRCPDCPLMLTPVVAEPLDVNADR